MLENIHDYTRSDLTIAQNLFNIINMRSGGLTFYGGLLLATPCCILYARFRKVPILLGMDIVVRGADGRPGIRTHRLFPQRLLLRRAMYDAVGRAVSRFFERVCRAV